MALVDDARLCTVSTLADTKRAVYATSTFFFCSASFINILLTNNNNLNRARIPDFRSMSNSLRKKRTGNNSALLLVICRYHVEIGINIESAQT